MRPLYLILIFYALFITGFGDVLELIFATILPGVGIAIGIPLAMVINITMGSGLIFLLAQNGMFHPKFGPAGIIAGILPVIDSLPIWLALVITGILYKNSAEKKEAAGLLAKTAVSASSPSSTNPVTVINSNRPVTQTVHGLPVVSSTANTPQRTPLNLKSPRMIDVTPHVSRVANDNQHYVQKAA